MKTYSSVDLLGREEQLAQPKNSFTYWIVTWLDRQMIEVELNVTIPYSIFIRTNLICDYIKSVYETPMTVTHFLNILYVDFIHRYMKRHNPTKMYEELTKYHWGPDTLKINDPRNKRVYVIPKNQQTEITLTFTISKANVKRGEMLLADLDELTGKYITVEELLSRLWINFIQSFSDGDNEKAIDKLLRMAAKNF